MSRSDALKNWGLVVGVLIFAGVASAVWLWRSSQPIENGGERASVTEELDPVSIQVKDYVLGSDLLQIPFIADNVDGLQMSQPQAMGIMIGITVVAMGAFSLPLALAYVFLGRQAKNVQEDEEFQAAISRLREREKVGLKQLNQERSASEPESAPRLPSWSVVSTSLVIIGFVWFTALALGDSFFGDRVWEVGDRLIGPSTVFGWILVLVTVVILFFYFRGRERDALDSGATDNLPVAWGWIWVILSGLLIVGVGTGLAIAMRAVAS